MISKLKNLYLKASGEFLDGSSESLDDAIKATKNSYILIFFFSIALLLTSFLVLYALF